MSNHIKELSTEDNGKLKLTFQGDEMTPAFVNSLRRICMAEIVTYSLMDVEILHNTSRVYKNNQFVSDRVKLIPIYINDPKHSSLVNEKLFFYISAKDDSTRFLRNEADDTLTITAHDFQIFDEEKNLNHKYDIKEIIKYPLPILSLRKGEEVHIKVSIKGGVGALHASWKGCIPIYKWENTTSLNPQKDAKRSLITNEVLETMDEKRNYPKTEMGNPKNISLSICDNGHYDSDIVFRLALDKLEEKLLILSNLMDNPKASQDTVVEIIPNANFDMLAISIKIEDKVRTPTFLATETIGKLLSSAMFYILYEKVQGNIDKLRECLCTDRKPHPLDNIIYIDIKTAKDLYSKVESQPRQLFNDTIEKLLKLIKEVKTEFSAKYNQKNKKR